MEIPTTRGKNQVTGSESKRPDLKKPDFNLTAISEKRESNISPGRHQGLSIKAETLNKFADNEALNTARDKDLQPLITENQVSIEQPSDAMEFDLTAFEADCANHEMLVEFTKTQFKEVHQMFKVAKNRILKA